MAADAVGPPPWPAPPREIRAAARGIAVGRLATGATLLLAPGVTGPWLGRRAARSAPARVAVRALGVRDVLLGALTLHTLDHPQAGPRWLATCAIADAVDAAATWAERDRLPATAAGVVVLAAGAAAAQVGLAALLRREAG